MFGYRLSCLKTRLLVPIAGDDVWRSINKRQPCYLHRHRVREPIPIGAPLSPRSDKKWPDPIHALRLKLRKAGYKRSEIAWRLQEEKAKHESNAAN